MPEIVEFVKGWFAEVEDRDAPGRLRQVSFRRGVKMSVEIHPVDNEKGAAQSAHLRLADGTTALHVPLACIAVGTKPARAA